MYKVPLALLATSLIVTSCTSTTQAPAPTDLDTQTTVETSDVLEPTIDTVDTSLESTENTTDATDSDAQVYTRTEVVTYQNPATPKEPVEFSVSVQDGVIVSASATPKADNQISQDLQTRFASELEQKVVGKKIEDLDLDAIGGASLTTKAFETFVKSFPNS